MILQDLISLESIIQIILVIVIITQTRYVGNSITFTRKITQYNMAKEWEDRLYHIFKNNSPGEDWPDQIYQNIVNEFSNMDSLFRNKLLKPVEFTTLFYRLYIETLDKNNSNLELYRENYFQLQRIYKNFNKVDVCMKIFGQLNLNDWDEMTSQLKSVWYTKEMVKEANTKYINKIFNILKIWFWIRIYVKKLTIFELPEIK